MASDRNWIKLEHSNTGMSRVDGILLLENVEPASVHLPKIKALEIRDDDVMLCSYVKSGKHGSPSY